MFGLYIHIPYCRSKCRYCDFYSTPCPDGVPEAYIDALCREMDRFSPCGSTPLRPDTLYFGGGTPSLLTPAQAARLIRAAGPVPGAEITLEANPETVTPERLAAFRRAGVNRLSLGIQTARDDSLARLGRRHTAAQSRRALGMAVQAGFTDISGDLMLALPAYTMAELDETIALLAESGCTHISGYLLKIEPNTVFGKRPPEALPDDDAAADFYLAAVEKLAALGYAQYEISNFARPGFESRHNRIYWDCGDYLGLGPAAHSCMGGKRFATPAGTAAFLAAPAVYEPQGECTAEDYIMLQLRLSRGLSLSALRARYGVSFSSEKLRFLQTLAEHGLAVFDGSVLRLTPRGMLVQNSILCELV
ncbi:MAG: radical SAM family heme chaperone HemW [Ruthenibacterium lactatiformans]|nr:radical SAM family heme chaperone HemW [Ruthenibacterium lactatiformans]MDY4945189.1 radical SAM family heme chaperone HemW [Ruthenibacterium lactatiformans]